jgi:transcriptional regulatory protein LevR
LSGNVNHIGIIIDNLDEIEQWVAAVGITYWVIFPLKQIKSGLSFEKRVKKLTIQRNILFLVGIFDGQLASFQVFLL